MNNTFGAALLTPFEGRAFIFFLAPLILSGCGVAHKEIRLEIKEPLTIRVLADKAYLEEWGVARSRGPVKNDDGSPIIKPPRCFFRFDIRTIFVNAFIGTDCLLHELAHAAGLSNAEAQKINGWR